ncbi:MAG TPA: hypothetical protein VHX86_11155 [Tepidisphaeraceae bacterium]|nr:hypothetical protein [Tepidisphaeraceae bacterium]
MPAPPVISGDVAAPSAEADVPPPQTSTGVINTVMYQLQTPFGANSRDDAFWKLVDEDVVDVPTGRMLNYNGLRAGRARVADWPRFLTILEKESALKISENRMMASSAIGDVPLRVSDVLPEELLFIYDDHGLTMRSFSDCQNELSLAFQWAPRKPQTVRVTICPVVEAWRTRFDYSLNDDPRPTKYLRRENYYDLHFSADIAPGEFLVVGTSPATQDPNRIGSRFLTRDGPNQRYEELLILVGQPIPMNRIRTHTTKPATHPAQASPGKRGT